MTRGDVMRKNQKGFLIALCLCMLSISGIFGVYQYQKGQDPESGTTIPEETAQTDDTQVQESQAANSEGTVAQTDTKEDQAKLRTEDDIYHIGEAELAQAEEQPEEDTEAPQMDTDPSVETSGQQAGSGRIAFSQDSSLLWPVDGDVILNYSMDKSIYFSTLNQYKYHPAIVISAPVGSEVQCAADGKVSWITVDEETGTTLTMDLGNGYEAVYGQLKEVAVKEGDTVESGELLGYVSEPTKYYTLEGSNLYFQLLKDGEPQNPMDYMK